MPMEVTSVGDHVSIEDGEPHLLFNAAPHSEFGKMYSSRIQELSTVFRRRVFIYWNRVRSWM